MDRGRHASIHHKRKHHKHNVSIMMPHTVSRPSPYKPPYYPEINRSRSPSLTTLSSSTPVGHRPLQILLIVLACLAFLVTIFFSFLFGYGSSHGIFMAAVRNGIGTVSDKFSLEVTPARWTFGIWIFIYVWQALFLCYALSTICRSGPAGGYLYYDNKHIPAFIYAIYMLNLALNIGWLFLWDHELLHATLGALFLIAALLLAILFVLTNRLANFGLELIRANLLEEIWLVTLAAHNGLAMYCAWVVHAATLNLGIILRYFGGVQDYIASCLVLAIICFAVLFYSFADFFLVDRCVRYLFTPYIVAIVYLCGVMTKEWDRTKVNFILTVVLLGLVSFLTLVKVILVVWRYVSSPVFEEALPPPNNISTDKTVALYPYRSMHMA